MNHVAWNCDGKKLAAVGIDKITRVWTPEKSVRTVFIKKIITDTFLGVDGTSLCYYVYWRP